MRETQLLFVTGIVEVDRLLIQTVETFESNLPGGILAYYLDGSLVDGDATATSDLDLTLVVSSRFGDDNAWRRLNEVVTLSRHNARMELDIGLVDEHELAGGLTPMFKHASRLLYGQEIRGRYPLMPVEDWATERMNAAYWLLNQVFGRPTPVRYPLQYPDPEDSFGGYARRTICLSDGNVVPSTRDLVRVSGWIGTALIACQTGHYVARKRDCHRAYRTHIGDQWSSMLEDIYDRCRSDWGYLVPTSTRDRQRLRAICGRMLGFENHFLTIYRDVLLEQLRLGVPRACWLMERVPLDDPVIGAAWLETKPEG